MDSKFNFLVTAPKFVFFLGVYLRIILNRALFALLSHFNIVAADFIVIILTIVYEESFF